MLLRFIIENIASFKNAVEFNTFPSSKSQSHSNHKITCDHTTALRMSTIYGANGAGKSNLIDSLYILKEMVKNEKEVLLSPNELSFKFDKECKNKPSETAIEFFYNGNIFYYHLALDTMTNVEVEELYLSKGSRDVYLFIRKDGKITMNDIYLAKGVNEQFMNALSRLVRPDMLLLSFMGKIYPEEVPMITDAYLWFAEKLEVMIPQNSANIVPHLLDTHSHFLEQVNALIPELKTGISRLEVRKKVVNEEHAKENRELQMLIAKAKAHPNEPQIWEVGSKNIQNIVYEGGVVYMKSLIPIHHIDNEDVEIPYESESDGTRRLIEYMPLFYAVTQEDKVFVVDEIERSIHPIMIKDLMRKLSESKTAKGQLIFTTHESGLLDQNIFRPDEIWFAQKDAEQATQLYPLSDFNIHKTANIENGYLNGRYGGIPFLSNLKDLHW